MTFKRILACALLLAGPTALAANHAKSMAPLGEGSFPVACSNLAQDEARLAALGGQPAQFWEGIPDGGNGRYVTQILADPAATLQFALRVPDDRGLYEHFADDTLPMVVLVCYPTTTANIRSDYRLPDGQWLPRMERTGDQPLFPAGNGKLPLVVYSHGLGGSPVSDDYLQTIRILASHGYVVMAPFHGDARVTRIRIADLGDLFYLATNFDRYVELQALRPLGLKQALDYVLSLPAYADRIDTTQIGGFGASLGGEAMLLTMGARLTQSYTTLSSRPVEQDPRIKAAAGYVPYAGLSFLPAFGDDQHGTASVTRPFLALSGTTDTTAPIKLAEQAINRLQGSRYLVALENVPHEYQPAYSNDVFSWVITFLNAHVREDRQALARLVQMSNVAGGLDDQVRIDYTAPTAVVPGQVLITEFANRNTGHYINAIGPDEVAFVSGFADEGWSVTGLTFKAWTTISMSGQTPVCRFYRANGSSLMGGRDTLFLTTDQPLCEVGKAMPQDWLYLGTPIALLSTRDGLCPDGTIAINRDYNLAATVNHRFTTSNATSMEMARRGWRDEGAEMCAPL